MSELSRIPNVGKATERDLNEMGYTTVESLKGKTGEELYAQECAMRGVVLDRCQLYLLRAVEYFVNTENPDPEKCKWWYWKDEFAEPSPCGAVCVECALFPASCALIPGAGEIASSVRCVSASVSTTMNPTSFVGFL